jgi:hypothetical protein
MQKGNCALQFHSQSLEWMGVWEPIAGLLAVIHSDLHLRIGGLHQGESLAVQSLWMPSCVSCLVQTCGACFLHCMYAYCNACVHKTKMQMLWQRAMRDLMVL